MSLETLATNRSSSPSIPPPPPHHHQHQKQPSKTIEDLPKEIMHSILSKLPLNSVFQSRYVSPIWRSLINDTAFSKLHYTHFSQNPHPNTIILVDNGYAGRGFMSYIPDLEKSDTIIDLANFPYGFNSDHDSDLDLFPWEIAGSVNGLICFLVDAEHHFTIWNPVTGDFAKSPSICFDWVRYRYGFGWNLKTNEYKLVVLHQLQDKMHQVIDRLNLEAKIYTVGSDSWRSIGTIPSNLSREPGVFCNGKLHWFLFDKMLLHSIRTIDVEHESFGVISVPDGIKGKTGYRFKLQVVGGCLVIGAFAKEEKLVAVWVRKDYSVEESWTLQYVVPVPDDCTLLKPLEMLQNGNVLLFCEFDPCEGGDLRNELSSYDPITRTHEFLRINGIPEYFSAFSHVGTLVTVKDAVSMQKL